MKSLMISFMTALVVMIASTAGADEIGSMLDKSVTWQSQTGRQNKVASGHPRRKGNVYIREVTVRFEGTSMKVTTKRGNNGFWKLED